MADFDPLRAQHLFNTRGRVAVVTGGGTGLGLMTAKALCANGMKVYITGRRLSKLREAEQTDSESGGSIIALQMDCNDKASIAAGVAAITKHEQFLNLLVNNAGVTSVNYGPTGAPQGSVQDISTTMFASQDFSHWLDIYQINVASYYFTSVAFLPLLVRARDFGYSEAGNILNISSISGITKESQNGQFAYNASKAATISLTEQLATEWKRPDLEVRVNTLAPGYFPSQMSVDRGEERQEGKEFYRDPKGHGVPLGRFGRPRDYAQAVLAFAMNEYVTGSTLVIDGGWLLAHA